MPVTFRQEVAKMQGKIWTRQQLGGVLPDGWFIQEHEGWFLPCYGEIMTLTPTRSLRAACDAITIHCVMGLARNVAALGQMVLAQRDMFDDEVNPAPQGAAQRPKRSEGD